MNGLNNLQLTSTEVRILAALVIILVSTLVFYLRKNFIIAEITAGPPWLKLLRQAPTIYSIKHNLPQPDYGNFVGRRDEIQEIERVLRPYPHSQYAIVTIDGVGGVGKSALALEVAHRHLRSAYHLRRSDRFGAIIWVSAKKKMLTASGLISRTPAIQTLQDLLSAICSTLDLNINSQSEKQTQLDIVRRGLTNDRVLLIVDNLETIDDESLIHFLRELPAPTKAIITTRHRLDAAYPIRLTGMDLKDAQMLITEECNKKMVRLTEEEIQRLYTRTGGIPLAIVWTIAQIAFGYPPETVLKRLSQHDGDVANYCFKSVVQQIRHKPAFLLLAALSILEGKATRGRLGYIANLPELDRDDGLVELEKLSLVNREGNSFFMLPLTRDYVIGIFEQDPALRNRLSHRASVVYFNDMAQLAEELPSQTLLDEIKVPVGIDLDGKLYEFRLGAQTGAHAIVCGITGSGKTNFAQVFVASATRIYLPNQLSFFVMSPHAAGFQRFLHLPNTHLAISKSADSRTAVFELQQLLEQREQLLRQHVERNEELSSLDLKVSERLVVIVEELYTLQQDTEAINTLILLTQTGRKFGVHFIFTISRISGFPMEIYDQVSNRVVFRCADEDARILLDDSWNGAKGLGIGEALFQDLTGATQQIRIAFIHENIDGKIAG